MNLIKHLQSEHDQRTHGRRLHRSTEDESRQVVNEFLANLPKSLLNKIDNVRLSIRNGTPSTVIYKRNGQWTAERAAMHKKVVDSFFEGKHPVNKPELIFTGGLPASGKSSVVRSKFDNHIVVDSDEVKQRFPDYEGWNAPLLHDESTEIVMQVFNRAVEEGYNIINDGTLRSQELTVELQQAAKEAGFSTRLIFVNVDMKTALNRMIRRFNQDGRFIDPAFMAEVGGNPVRVYQTLKNTFDSYEAWDNNGDHPILIESSP